MQIGFEINKEPLDDLISSFDKIKPILDIVANVDQKLVDLGESTNRVTDDVKDLSKSFETVTDTNISGLDDDLSQTKKTLSKVSVETKNLAKVKVTKELSKIDKVSELAHKGVQKLKTGIKEIGKIGLEKTISGLNKITKLTAKGVETVVGGIAGATSKAVKTVTKGVAIASGVLAVGTTAVFSYGSAYETSLAKTSTLLDQNIIGLDELGSKVLELSNDTGVGATELQESVYQALSAGADAAGVTEIVRTAVKAAKGGFTDTTTAIDGLTSTLNAYGMETAQAEALANSFLITQNKGKTTFGELAGSIGGVAPTANAAGVGVDQLLAGVASLTANGIGTSEAMTGMKAALSNVIKPSAEASKMAEQLGLDFSTSAIQSKGWIGFLEDIKKKTGGNSDVMAKLFGSVEALNTVLTLTSDNGSKLMNDTLTEMSTNTSALDDAYKTMTETAASSVEKGINSFKNLGIGIYQDSKGIFSELTGLFAKTGKDLYQAFADGGMDGLTAQIGNSLSDIVLKISEYAPSFVKGGTTVLKSLLQGIAKNKDSIADSAADTVTELINGVADLLPDVLLTGGDFLLSFANGILERLPELLSTGKKSVQKLVSGISQRMPEILHTGGSLVKVLVNSILESLPSVLNSGTSLLNNVVTGIVSNLPYLTQTGISLIETLTQALLDNLPSIISSGITLLIGLIGGIGAMLPTLIQSGTDLVISLATSLVDNLPLILETGITFVLNFIEGIAAAVPDLLGEIPKIVTGIIKGLLSVNWLKVGLNIIGSIGKGLVNGIKSLFGFGKKSAEETVEGVESVLDEPIEVDTNIDFNIPSSDDVLKELELPSVKDKTLPLPISIPPIDILNLTASMSTVSTLTDETMGEITNGIDTSMIASGLAIEHGMDGLLTSTENGTLELQQLVTNNMDAIQSQVEAVDLFPTGQNVMEGLKNGILSKKAELINMAKSIANCISGSINTALDIHSPSRVTAESGRFVVLGVVKGIQEQLPVVERESWNLGETLAEQTDSGTKEYTPEGSSYSRTVSHITNQYDANFNLTIQGSTEDRSIERKVKKWIKEGIDEYFARMRRSNPQVSEV